MNGKYRKLLLAMGIGLFMTACAFMPGLGGHAKAESAAVKAEYLLDEDFSFLAISTYDATDIVASGWDVRRAGGAIAFGFNSWFKITDTSPVLPVSMSKQLVEQTSGELTLEYRFKLPAVMNGVKWQMLDGDIPAVSLGIVDGKLSLETGGSWVELQTVSANAEYGVKAVTDLDTGKVRIYVNGVLRAAEADFTQSTDGINRFLVTTGDVTTGEMFFAPVKIHKGYTVNERFLSTVAGPLPVDWSSQLNGGSAAVEKMDNAKAPDVFSLKLNTAGAVGPVSIARPLPAQAGKLVVEFKVFLPAKQDGFSMEAGNGNGAVFQWLTHNGQFAYRNSQNQLVEFYDYLPNLWYHLKLKWDTETGLADLYLNGKLKAEQISLTEGEVDELRFAIAAATPGIMSLDDVLLYHETTEPLDYVAAPVPAVKVPGAPAVGVQACPLWREGQHLGWDRINPYSERTPLLGFYDEGNPEVSDWEIKWMEEHGIDFQMYCWYRPNGNEGKPLKDPRLGMAIHDGFFNAKYSSQSQFMIMWTSPVVTGSADFRNNLVPYWLEYYFKDPRYVVIDNKPVLAIFGYAGLKNSLGGTSAAVEAEMAYLRQAVQAAGFDDIIILVSNSGSDPATLADVRDGGADAVFAYSWGLSAGSEDLQKSKLQQQRDAGVLDVIPVVSMGRDDRAWGGSAGYYATPSEFQSTAQWVKDSFIPSLPAGSPGRELVLLDNWNEYGEGHFIMPSQLYGFGYVDAIREVFTQGGGHSDAVPSQAQQERIQLLYPQGRTLPLKTAPIPPIAELGSIAYSQVWDFDTDDGGWTVAKQVYGAQAGGGYYNGTSTGSDPGIHSPDNLGVSAALNPYLHIRMKNSTGDVAGKIYFITEKDQAWKEAKGVDFLVKPNDSGYTDYYVPMGANSLWSGTIKAVRLDPITVPGDFSIDRIGFVHVPISGPKLALNGEVARTVTPLEEHSGSFFVPLAEMLQKLKTPMERDEEQALIAVEKGSVIRLVPGEATAYKDGLPVIMPEAAYLQGNELMVPADALEELFGFYTAWSAVDSTLYLMSGPLRVHGNNLVVDPGMEGSTLAQTGYRIAAELTAEEAHSGSQSVKITKEYSYAKIYFPGVTVGQEYYYSAWSKLHPSSTMGEKLRICLEYKLDGVNKQVVMLVGPAMNASAWQQTQGYFTLNETGTVSNLTMYIYTDSPALADTYYLDDVEMRPVTYSHDPLPPVE
jgi:hypothetical protein